MRSVFVSGYGRSGTSMLSGLFSGRGFYQGDDLYEPRKANPKGFFENWAINSLNERIMVSSIGARYDSRAAELFQAFYRPGHHWLALLPRDLPCVASEGDRKDIAGLVARPPMCFKDPRFSFTLAPWQEQVPNSIALCVFRHPGIVIASVLKELQAADYLRELRVSIADLYAGWRLAYLRLLESRAGGKAVHFVRYDDLFWSAKLDEIEELVGAGLNREFPEKRYERSSYDGELDPETGGLFEALSALAARPLNGQSPEACGAITAQFQGGPAIGRWPLYGADETQPENQPGGRKSRAAQKPSHELGSLRSLVWALQDKGQDLAKQLSGRADELAEREARIAALESELGARLAQLQAAETQARDSGATLAEARQAQDAMRAVLTNKEEQIRNLELLRAGQEGQLERTRHELESREARLAELDRELGETRARASEQAFRMEVLAEDLSRRDKSIDMLRADIDRLHQEDAGLRSALGQQDRQFAAIETRLSERERDLQEFRKAVEAAEAEAGARLAALDTSFEKALGRVAGLESGAERSRVEARERDGRIEEVSANVAVLAESADRERAEAQERDGRIEEVAANVAALAAHADRERAEALERDGRIEKAAAELAVNVAALAESADRDRAQAQERDGRIEKAAAELAVNVAALAEGADRDRAQAQERDGRIEKAAAELAANVAALAERAERDRAEARERDGRIGDLAAKVGTLAGDAERARSNAQELDERLRMIVERVGVLEYGPGDPSAARFVEKHKGFWIFRMGKMVYGVREALGEVDLTVDPERLATCLGPEDFVAADSVDAVRAGVRLIDAERTIRTLSERVAWLDVSFEGKIRRRIRKIFGGKVGSPMNGNTPKP